MRNHKWIVSVVLINIVFLLNGQSDSLYSFSRPAMGTIYYVSFFAHKEVNAPLIAEKVFEEVQPVYADQIVTQLKPFEVFYEAEDYHQNYYNNNQEAGYCQVVIDPKVQKLKKMYADKLIS